MANTQEATILSGAYVNPFAQQAQNKARNNDSLVSAQVSPVQKPEFAALIAEMDSKLLAHSEQTTKSETLAQNSAQNSDYNFFDLIDLINPLQHIPVVSNIYRAVTGDEIRQEIRMAGNVLFGAITGPVGIAMGVGSATVDYASGKPVGDHVLAAVAPDLETTIREEYSIAHYLHNPFASDEAAEVAAITQDVPQVPRRVVDHAESQELYAQTASALRQKLDGSTPQADPAPIQVASLDDLAPQIPPKLQPAILPEAKEAQAMAKSVAYNPNTVVQLSPEAAAQLSKLASGTEESISPALGVLGTGSDGAAQLRAVTAKNRQLGIALGSSASISHQLDSASQKEISQEISNKVAALYHQNAGIGAITPLNDARTPVPALFDALESTPAPKTVKVAQNTPAVQTPLQPQQLGKHYHGAHSVGNLSIAAAMQQALDKYQNLRRN